MRNLLEWIYSYLKTPLVRLDSYFDGNFLASDVPRSVNISHGNWNSYLVELANKPGKRVLEIGSREVTGSSRAREDFHHADYVGFDFYAGENVDVVGDAHKLASYFDETDRFDLVYTSACFEHFAMPWLVAQEIAKVLNVGGYVFIETHFSYSSHERPWHFFQFSDMALRALFPEAMGFQCLEAGMSNPMVGRFSAFADPYLRLLPISNLFCHSEFLGMKMADVPDFSWQDLDLRDVAGDTTYPEPQIPG